MDRRRRALLAGHGVDNGALSLIAAVLEPARFRALLRFRLRWMVIGILSAALLYMVFSVGNVVSRAVLSQAASQIEQIYVKKEGLSLS